MLSNEESKERTRLLVQHIEEALNSALSDGIHPHHILDALLSSYASVLIAGRGYQLHDENKLGKAVHGNLCEALRTTALESLTKLPSELN